jgi:ribosomal protein S18 acetylase RimI-like enzyme
VIIRPAVDRDADELPEVERLAGSVFRQWPGLEWIADDEVQSAEEHRAFMAEGVCLVAEEPGHGVVGFLSAELEQDVLHIWEIAVLPEYQRRGVGGRLIAEARRIATQMGARALTLTTFREVTWNQPWYERLGFHTLPDESLTPRLRRILEDEGRAGLPLDQRCAMLMPTD